MQIIDNFHGEYFFLSNFYPSPLETEKGIFPTVEHAYQAAKTTDDALIEWVRVASSPGKAKKFGRMLPVRHDWEIIKYDVMFYFVQLKFESNGNLRQSLLETKDAQLIEANWWGDTYWGVCRGVGQNNLGKILMEIRENVKNTC